MHIPLIQLLLSKENLLKEIVLLYVGIFSVNLILMVNFIPQYGFIAASWITVIAESITFAAFLTYIKKKGLA